MCDFCAKRSSAKENEPKDIEHIFHATLFNMCVNVLLWVNQKNVTHKFVLNCFHILDSLCCFDLLRCYYKHYRTIGRFRRSFSIRQRRCRRRCRYRYRCHCHRRHQHIYYRMCVYVLCVCDTSLRWLILFFLVIYFYYC
jgi:hypothetical protein